LGSAQIDNSNLARCLSPEGLPLALAHSRVIPIGIAVTRTAFLSDTDFERSEFYNKLMRPMNGFHHLYVRQAQPSASFALGVGRPRRAAAYEPAEIATLQTLVPHLTTAVELHRRLQVAQHGHAGVARALDSLNVGVVLTDASARPSFVNARAAKIVLESRALKLDDSGLAAATPAATRALRQAIPAVSADCTVTSKPLRLQHASQPLPLLLTPVPIFRLDPMVPGARAPRVAIFIQEPGAVPAIDREAVGDAFRLTRRETDVAILLAGGLGPEEIAIRLRLGVGTVRHHLKGIFQKSGVHTQAALVTLIRGFDLIG
jgi:DNA-binding CsgD family transcriptional regulator